MNNDLSNLTLLKFTAKPSDCGNCLDISSEGFLDFSPKKNLETFPRNPFSPFSMEICFFKRFSRYSACQFIWSRLYNFYTLFNWIYSNYWSNRARKNFRVQWASVHNSGQKTSQAQIKRKIRCSGGRNALASWVSSDWAESSWVGMVHCSGSIGEND